MSFLIFRHMAKKSASETAPLKKEIREQTTPLATSHQAAYKNFVAHLKLLIGKNPHLITTTLSNIFTMRLIKGKDWDDLAERSFVEFINRNMYDFRARIGRRGRVEIMNEITKKKFCVMQ